MFFSVIIPTRDRAASLKRTLASLRTLRQPSTGYEIIVVDNGSSDGTEAVAREAMRDMPQLRYVFEPVPGMHAGRHRGALESRGDVFCYLDDDVTLYKYWFQSVERAFEDQSVALAGGPSIGVFEAEIPMWYRKYICEESGRITCPQLSLIDFGNTEMDVDPVYVWGLNFSIRREVYFALGGFRPDCIPKHLQHFQGDGETGLSAAIRERGLRARYLPGAKVMHHIPSSRLTAAYLKDRNFYQGVCDSFSRIRARGTCEGVAVPAAPRFDPRVFSDPVERESEAIYAEIAAAHTEGFAFHHRVVSKSPTLLAWVLRSDYFEYRLPDLSCDFKDDELRCDYDGRINAGHRYFGRGGGAADEDSRALVYVSSADVERPEAKLLSDIGLSGDHLAKAGERSAERERALWAGIGFDPNEFGDETEYPAYLRTMMRKKIFLSVCPFCGRVASTRDSFPVFYDDYSQNIFYRFSCCRPWYLLVCDSRQRVSGVYIPGAEIFYQFVDQRVAYLAPCEHRFYANEVVGTFLAYMSAHRDEVDAYLTESRRLNVCAIGFVGNIGHSIGDEPTMMQHFSESGDLQRPDAYLLGPYRYLPVSALFPELSAKTIDFPSLGSPELTRRALFVEALRTRMFLFRLSSFCTITDTFFSRVLSSARRLCDEEGRVQIAHVLKHDPIVFVTLRGHVRSWRAQNDVLPRFLRAVRESHPRAAFVFDGMKGEEANVAEISAAAGEDITVFSAVGCPLWRTVLLTSLADLAVIPLGAGIIFPILANTPTIFHTHSTWVQELKRHLFPREGATGDFVPADVTWEDAGKDVFTRDYDIAEERLLAVADEILVRRVSRAPNRAACSDGLFP